MTPYSGFCSMDPRVERRSLKHSLKCRRTDSCEMTLTSEPRRPITSGLVPILEKLEASASRLDLNDPPTTVGGIPEGRKAMAVV